VLVRFTKVSDDTHRFSVTTKNGSQSSAELVSRSFLLHDFVHLALETEAALGEGFYGLLARDVSFEELNQRGSGFLTRDLELAEALTGPMQAVQQGRFSKEDYVLQLSHLAPSLVTTEFVTHVLERLRRLMGHYRSLDYGETMEVKFEQDEG